MGIVVLWTLVHISSYRRIFRHFCFAIFSLSSWDFIHAPSALDLLGRHSFMWFLNFILGHTIFIPEKEPRIQFSSKVCCMWFWNAACTLNPIYIAAQFIAQAGTPSPIWLFQAHKNGISPEPNPFFRSCVPLFLHSGCHGEYEKHFWCFIFSSFKNYYRKITCELHVPRVLCSQPAGQAMWLSLL